MTHSHIDPQSSELDALIGATSQTDAISRRQNIPGERTGNMTSSFAGCTVIMNILILKKKERNYNEHSRRSTEKNRVWQNLKVPNSPLCHSVCYRGHTLLVRRPSSSLKLTHVWIE